jgi:pimeloyl-ACP methyl ester carboxylesterase
VSSARTDASGRLWQWRVVAAAVLARSRGRALQRVAAALAIGAVGLASGASSALAGVTRDSPARVSWAVCPPSPSGLPDFGQQCAIVPVPLDYRHPAGRRITIAISRIAARDPGLRRGILLVNPGGPGEPGLVDLPRELEPALPQAVLDRYDIIGFDPRGVEYSSPVSCGLTAEQAFEASPPLMQPGGFAATVAFERWVADRCAATSGAVLPYITTANTARDMDVIRAVLGEPKLSYLGYSYGTYLGAVHASLFPDRTDRVILDSSEGPHYVWRAALRLLGLGGDLRFPDFAAFAAANDATYHFGATPQAVEQTYYRLLYKAHLEHVTLPDGTVVDGGALFRRATFFDLYDDSQFPSLLELWRVVAEAPLAAALPVLSPTVAGDPVPADPQAAQLAVVCDDARWPRSVAEYRFQLRIDELLHPKFAEVGSNIWPCAFWAYRPLEPPVTINPVGPRNVLILENLRDPATPLPLALDMRASFGNRASLVTVDEGGHGVLGNSANNTCALQLASAFLISGALPGDTFCPANPPGTTAPKALLTNPAQPRWPPLIR